MSEASTHPTGLAPPPAVADATVEPLLERCEELAQRWLAGLVLVRPLPALGDLELERLAEGAPSLCRGLLHALSSDAELDRLGDAGEAAATAALAAAGQAAQAVQAVEVLRGAAWSLLAEQLGLPADAARARRHGEAGDRLAHACARLAAASVATLQLPGAEAPANAPAGRAAERAVVIVDELRSEEPPRASAAPEPPAERIEIRDVRRPEGEGPAAWVGSIGAQLERYERDGLPFAVILIEARPGERGARFDDAELERALADELELAGGGTITRERSGRYWLLAPRADRIGAHALAARLERTARAAAQAGGASVPVAGGVAVCPEDGRNAAALAAQADIGLYAARWEARSRAHAAEEPS